MVDSNVAGESLPLVSQASKPQVIVLSDTCYAVFCILLVEFIIGNDAGLLVETTQATEI